MWCVFLCVSDLVVVTDEDVNGRQEQLKHRLLVTLLHLEAEPLQEAGRTFGTLAAAVLEAPRRVRKHEDECSENINTSSQRGIAGRVTSQKHSL